MPPKSPVYHESEQLKKAANTLEKKVDALEPQAVKNTPQDWSEEVKRVVEIGENRIRLMVADLSPYLDDPEKFLAEKLKAYRKEVEEITRELPRETKNIDIYSIPEGQTHKKIELIGTMARAKKMAAENPDLFISMFEVYSKIDDGAEVLLEEAVRKCIDTGDESILLQNYELLHTQAFFEDEVASIAIPK